ncbi:hypothetical protein J6590_033485 [Homalodisca vitripennis]|nr:hypothetical protein J6590_033485 [Homalodisca vitripennis]
MTISHTHYIDMICTACEDMISSLYERRNRKKFSLNTTLTSGLRSCSASKCMSRNILIVQGCPRDHQSYYLMKRGRNYSSIKNLRGKFDKLGRVGTGNQDETSSRIEEGFELMRSATQNLKMVLDCGSTGYFKNPLNSQDLRSERIKRCSPGGRAL